MIQCRIDVYSHGVKFSHMTPSVRRQIMQYCRENLVHTKRRWDYRRKRYISETDRVYAFSPSDRRYVMFNRCRYANVMAFLASGGIREQDVVVTTHLPSRGVRERFEIVDRFTDRDYQLPIIEFGKDPDKSVTVIPVQTGRGKTYMALRIAQILGRRFAILCLATYTGKWLADVLATYKIDESDINVIVGAANIEKAIILAKKGEYDYPVTIFSLETIDSYIKTTELTGTSISHSCAADLFKLLGIGLCIKDEVHQHFYQVYRQDTYMNCFKNVYLSATLIPDDEFMKGLFLDIWPMDSRYNNLAYVKYIDVQALQYNISGIKDYQWQRNKAYSQDQFETTLLKYPDAMDSFLDMIDTEATRLYRNEKVDGDKLLIYADKVAMCNVLAERMRKSYPDLTVNTFNGSDDYSVIQTSDITISTPVKAGAAVDVPKLRRVLSISMSASRMRNEQMLGRLREREDGKDVIYSYVYTPNITKHTEYHNKLKEIFSNKTKTHVVRHTGYTVSLNPQK